MRRLGAGRISLCLVGARRYNIATWRPAYDCTIQFGYCSVNDISSSSPPWCINMQTMKGKHGSELFAINCKHIVGYAVRHLLILKYLTRTCSALIFEFSMGLVNFMYRSIITKMNLFSCLVLVSGPIILIGTNAGVLDNGNSFNSRWCLTDGLCFLKDLHWPM